MKVTEINQRKLIKSVIPFGFWFDVITFEKQTNETGFD